MVWPDMTTSSESITHVGRQKDKMYTVAAVGFEPTPPKRLVP